ncbi:SOS response-associated peptidase [Pelagibius litoralis]|uniref:Abasic site processing protein n=1 Tax=Pelagibius litoralis TaxID=374515 RepID=A0A967F0J0_9PROT|nr:SOS response-associated peptidase [Pelagibius litoralis]NIA70761.1 SOS response-associated peptidase [Pelagibius litoralis]
MCGRFLLTTPVDALRQLFGFAELPNLTVRFNVAPGQAVAAMRLDAGLQRHFAWLQWGLVPSWSMESRHSKEGRGRPMAPQIHARAETVAEKPTFRNAYRSRRCVVLADGFYEWRQDGNRQPYCIRLADNGPFAFAALWEPAAARSGATEAGQDSCALITTDAEGEMAAIHHRMPVILSPDDVGTWLDPASRPDKLQHLLRPLPGTDLSLTPVSKRVNAVKHDDAGLLEEERLPEAPSQLKLF